MFLINIKFHLAHSRLGHLTGLLSSPATTRLPSQFTIRVSRLTQAGYKVREVLEHRRDQRTTRTSLGQSKVEDGLTEALCCHKVSYSLPWAESLWHQRAGVATLSTSRPIRAQPRLSSTNEN